MKKLVAVMTCRKPGYRAKADAQRRSWVPRLRAQGVDVLFFAGAPLAGTDVGTSQPNDEMWLDVPDDYAGIPLKVKAIMRWAAERNYDYTSKVDDDVYVIPNRYAVLPLFPYDYIGRFRGPCGVYPAHFASGFFYTLSLKAARVVASMPWNGDWMDERFVANSLAFCGIYGHTDPLNYCVTGPFHKPEDLVRQPVLAKGTAFCQYGAADMLAMHHYFADAMPLPVPGYLYGAPRCIINSGQLNQLPTDCIPREKLQRG